MSWPVPFTMEIVRSKKRCSGERALKDSPNFVFHALSTTEYVTWPTGTRSPIGKTPPDAGAFWQAEDSRAAEQMNAHQNNGLVIGNIPNVASVRPAAQTPLAPPSA
jgi:hypothetical protein